MTDKGKRITQLLLKQYPNPKIELNYTNAYELLVATILSAQCTDVLVNKVTPALFAKYPTVHHLAKASLQELEQDIRQINYFKNKAKMLIDCASKIVSEYGGQVPDTLEALTSLAGVGRKTANVVLANAFGKQTIVVDTHMLRLSNKLGLAEGKDALKVEQQLMQAVPKEMWTKFSQAMVLHGRRVCTAKNPKCQVCVLIDECQWVQNNTEKGAKN